MANLNSPVPATGTDSKTWILAIYIALIVLAPVGVIIAYVKRSEIQGAPWESHITYAIRTFWIGVCGFLIGVVLTLVLIGILVIWAVSIWYLVRIVVGLVQAIGDKPIKNPQTWLV
jgi:uncharacterized membrane protein